MGGREGQNTVERKGEIPNKPDTCGSKRSTVSQKIRRETDGQRYPRNPMIN